MYHSKFDEAKALVEASVPILLTGEKGSGKTTLSRDITKHLELPFFSFSMTRQTTLSHLMGFISVNGTYISSQLRTAAESGGVVLLDEIDAADSNVILCLNTIENGYLSFPDKIVTLHEDFRLVATSNPQGNHKEYSGRSKLDAATLDRFDEIEIKLDENLEKSLVDYETYSHISLIRRCLKETNSSIYISMRDSLRFQKRKDLGLLDGQAEKLFRGNRIAYEKYLDEYKKLPKFSDISECSKLSEVWDATANTA